MLFIWHLVATRQDLCVDLLAPAWPGTQTTVCQIEPAGAGEMGTTRSLTLCCDNVAREERFNESLLLLLLLSLTYAVARNVSEVYLQGPGGGVKHFLLDFNQPAHSYLNSSQLFSF